MSKKKDKDNDKNVRVLKTFEGLKISEVGEDEDLISELMQHCEMKRETDIKKIEAYSSKVRKPILNFTRMDEEQKNIMESAVKNKVHVKVEFDFEGYWEAMDAILMLTTIKSIRED